jgi:3,4-dihydroxyphenylacetate 2,3-dioxygenase
MLGELVLAAKVSRVPSLMLSELPGSPLREARRDAVEALRLLGRRARER